MISKLNILNAFAADFLLQPVSHVDVGLCAQALFLLFDIAVYDEPVGFLPISLRKLSHLLTGGCVSNLSEAGQQRSTQRTLNVVLDLY